MQEFNQLICPKCKSMFPAGFDLPSVHFQLPQFMEHIKVCKKGGPNKEKKTEQELVYEKVTACLTQVPIDTTMTKFRWEKKPKAIVFPPLFGKTIDEIRKSSFQ